MCTTRLSLMYRSTGCALLVLRQDFSSSGAVCLFTCSSHKGHLTTVTGIYSWCAPCRCCAACFHERSSSDAACCTLLMSQSLSHGVTMHHVRSCPMLMLYVGSTSQRFCQAHVSGKDTRPARHPCILQHATAKGQPEWGTAGLPVLYLQARLHCVYGVDEALRHCAGCCACYDMPDLHE